MLYGALVVFAWFLLILLTACVAGLGGIILGLTLALWTNPFCDKASTSDPRD